MPARRIRFCPECSKPVPQRNYRSADGLRYHRDCLTDAEQLALSRIPPPPRGRGRPPTARGRGSPTVLVRLSVEQYARLQAEAAAVPPSGVTPAELLRRRAGL